MEEKAKLKDSGSAITGLLLLLLFGAGGVGVWYALTQTPQAKASSLAKAAATALGDSAAAIAAAGAAASSAIKAGQTATQAAAAGAAAAASVMSQGSSSVGSGSSSTGNSGAGSATDDNPVPQLNITNSGATVKKGSYLNFTFKNMESGGVIGVSVKGGGGVTVIADSTGSGSGRFIDGDPAGTYVLQATDTIGDNPTANFIVD